MPLRKVLFQNGFLKNLNIRTIKIRLEMLPYIPARNFAGFSANRHEPPTRLKSG